MITAGEFWLWGEIDDEVALSFAVWLLGNPEEPTLHLCTPGGPGHAMLAMMDAIERSGAPLRILASGRCLSAGVPVLAAGHVRQASRFTQFMLHGADGAPVEVAMRNGFQARHLAERTAKPRDFWLRYLGDPAGLWFGPEEALDWGLIDEILDRRQQ